MQDLTGGRSGARPDRHAPDDTKNLEIGWNRIGDVQRFERSAAVERLERLER